MFKIIVVFLLLHFCEEDYLFPDGISEILVIILWSFPAALMPGSFAFSSFYRSSREFCFTASVCLPGCAV